MTSTSTIDTAQVCALCGSAEHVVVATRGRFQTPLTNVVCQSCGLVYVHPRPDPSQIQRYYTEDYESSRLYFSEDLPAEELDDAAFKPALGRFRFLKAHTVLSSSGAVLEVGCGPGTFLGMFQDLGYDLWGVEPVPRLADYASDRYGARVFQGLFEDCDFGSQRFSLIAMFHVLEHVTSPLDVIKKCGELLSPGGILYLEVPDLFSPNRPRPEDFFQAAHLSTFSAQTLTRALAQGGFCPLVVTRCGYFLRAVARPGAWEGPLPGDDWQMVARMIERRRRWYPITGAWRDLAGGANAKGRQLAKQAILASVGRQRGRRVLSTLRKLL